MEIKANMASNLTNLDYFANKNSKDKMTFFDLSIVAHPYTYRVPAYEI